MGLERSNFYVEPDLLENLMQIRSDFSQSVVVRPGDIAWSPSLMAGVARQMLDRIGDEVARATAIVRYAENSHFDAHEHRGGEEFLVPLREIKKTA